MNSLAYWHDGAGPSPWVLLFPLVWIVVISCVISLLRRTVWRGGRGPGPYRGFVYHNGGNGPLPHEISPLALLGRRFAGGEIDEDEYRRRLSVLQEGDRQPGAKAK